MNILVFLDLDEDTKRYILKKLSSYGNVFFKEDVIKNEDILEEIDVLLITSGRRKLTREIISRSRKLKFLQTLSVGVDNLPFEIISESTLIASNSGANAEEVAEYTIGLLLVAAKKIHLNDRSLRRQIWNVHTPRIIKGSNILIWGYGNIGREIAIRLRPFKPNLYGVNRRGVGDDNIDFIYPADNVDSLLPLMDYIILTLPLTKYTRGIVDKKRLSLMKKDATLINVGRGDLIKEGDLYYHLLENPEFTAVIDVWWRYPKKRGEKYEFKYPFYKLDNIIMTPHVAGYWDNFRDKLIKTAIENILRFLKGERPLNIINREDYLND